MSGGLLQLVARGPDDIYLVNEPEITLFKTIYRRYSNFSITEKILRFDKKVGFDSKSICELRKYGDLLHKLYLVVDLPEIEMIYKYLTNNDVENMLLEVGITTWTYSGNPTDIVTKEQLPSIKSAIILQIKYLEELIYYTQMNNLYPLTELYDKYINNNINKNGIEFIHDYVGGNSDLKYQGIVYNKFPDGTQMDSTITPYILSEYNFTESYKLDNINDKGEIYNLNSVQNLTYQLYLSYILNRSYTVTNYGDFINPTINSLVLTTINGNSITTDISNNLYKNWYINSGLQTNRINTNENTTIITYNDFDFIPSVTENYILINQPSTYISGTIYDKVTMIESKNPLIFQYDDYYQGWYCKIDNISDILTVKNYNYEKKYFVLNKDLSDYNLIEINFYLTKANESDIIIDINGNVITTQYDIYLQDLGIYEYYLCIDNQSYLIEDYNNNTLIISGVIDVKYIGSIFDIVELIPTNATTSGDNILTIRSDILLNDASNVLIISNNKTSLYGVKNVIDDNTINLEINPKLIVPSINDSVIKIQNIINGQLLNYTYDSVINFNNTSLIYYPNKYIYYNSELHQIKSQDISNNDVTLHLIDNWINPIITDNSLYIINNIKYILDVSANDNNAIIFNNIPSDISNNYILYNNQLSTIETCNLINNEITLTTDFPLMPTPLDVCYIIDPNSINNIMDNNIQISRTVKLQLDKDPSNNKKIIINNQYYDIVSSDSSNNIFVTSNNNININYNSSYYLIENFDNSGTIIDISGNNEIIINDDIPVNTNGYLFCENQLIQINDYNNKTITLTSNLINMPLTNEECYIYDKIVYDNSGTSGIIRKNLLTRLNTNNNIDYRNSYIYVNSQLNQIKYYDISSNTCILNNNWLNPIGGPLPDQECILFTDYTLVYAGKLSNMSEIVYNVLTNVVTYNIYLDINSSNITNYYNGYYIELESTPGIREFHQIISYDGTAKKATIDTNFLNVIPLVNTNYILYSDISGQYTAKISSLINNIVVIQNDIDYDTGKEEDYTHWYLKINNDLGIIKYYDSSSNICIISRELKKDTSLSPYNILNSLPETENIIENTDYVLKLQNKPLSSINDYYINQYINIGAEIHQITSYNGQTHYAMIDNSGWLNIDDISGNYSIYDLSGHLDLSGTLVDVQLILDNYILINVINNLTPDDLENKYYISYNNEIYLIQKAYYHNSDPNTNLIEIHILIYDVVPKIGDKFYLFSVDFINNPIITGQIEQKNKMGVVLENNNLNTNNNYYDGWFLKINDTISQINTYFGDTTYAIISEDESIILNTIEPKITNYQLFSRLIDNIENDVIISYDNLSIKLAIQSSKIDNYYKGWYLEIDNETKIITSYDGATQIATIDSSFNNINLNKAYKLFNKMIEDNISFYSVIDLGLYSIIASLLNFPIKQLFDNVINNYYNNTNYQIYDAYNAYLYYFIENPTINDILITYSVNYQQVKIDLLQYIYNSIYNNMVQLQQVYNTFTYNIYSDPHFMLAFYFVYANNSSYNKIFVNASSNSILNVQDNFTNVFTINNPTYYSNYITQSVNEFHINNTNYFNQSTYTSYFQDINIWSYGQLNVLTNDVSGIYILNNVPIIIGNDICSLIIQRILNYNNNYNVKLFVNYLTTYIYNISNQVTSIVTNDLKLTDGDNNYIKNINTSIANTTSNILFGLFRPEFLYEFDNYTNLSALEFVAYKILTGAIYCTYHFQTINDEYLLDNATITMILIIINESVNTFLTPYNLMPSYTTYKNNNYKFNVSDPPKLSNALSSIWHNIWNSLKSSYNNLYQNKILNSSYYDTDLGITMKNLLNQASDIAEINFNTYDNYYQIDNLFINKINTMINNQINIYLKLYSNYTTIGGILNIKNIVIPPENSYYNTFTNTYNGIKLALETDPLTKNSYQNIIINNNNLIIETYNILNQYILCPFDIIGNSNQIGNELYINNDTIVDNFNIGIFSALNPYNNDTYLFNWYEKYVNDASANNFKEILSEITPNTLYNDKKKIDVYYNNFLTKSDITQYISDYIINKTSIKNIFMHICSSWNITYDNLLLYFNQIINTSNKYLIGIGSNDTPPTLYTNISNAVINTEPYFAWIKYLGYYLIKTCDITIGECVIDKHTGEYLYIRNQLDKHINIQNGLNNMIGNIKELYTYDNKIKKKKTLYIPLQFWFCRDAAHSLPLVAMNYTNIYFGLNTNSLENVAYWSSSSLFKKKPDIKCTILAEYIYIDENERKIISESKHEQLIELVQYNIYDYDYTKIINNTIEPYIYFNNMCKDLIWTIQPDNNYINYNNIDGFEKQWYNYQYNNGTYNASVKGLYVLLDLSGNPINGNFKPLIYNKPLKIIINCINPQEQHNNLYTDKYGNVYDDNNQLVLEYVYYSMNNDIYILNETIITKNTNYIDPVISATLKMNGNNRESTKDSLFFNAVNPYIRHQSSLVSGIYNYSFAIYPQLTQPSGALNLSKVENVNLVIELNQNLIYSMYNKQTKIKCGFYAVTYNVLRIMSGMAGLAFW